MKRVLVATVGGSPQPIVNALVQMRPDFVYFLCSTGKAGSDTQVEMILRAAQRGVDESAVEPVTSPDDLCAIVDACGRVQAALAERFDHEDWHIVANYTGGTKSMVAGLAIFALHAGWDLQVNTTGGERDNLVRISDGDVATPQDVAGLRETLRTGPGATRADAASPSEDPGFFHALTRTANELLAVLRRGVRLTTAVGPASPAGSPAVAGSLSPQTIDDLHRTAVDLDLGSEALLAGIPQSVVANLPLLQKRAERILVELHELNKMGTLADGSDPLAQWLNNAERLTRDRREVATFRRAHEALRRARRP